MILKIKLRLLIPCVLLLFISVQNANSQAPQMLRSTLNLSGSSSFVVLNGDSFFYQQSIGQEGLIGLNQRSPLALRQGFIQPLINFSRNAKDKNLLKVLVHPNPFNDLVKFTFEDMVKDKVAITIYNSWGRVVGNNIYEANQRLELNLNELSAGLYVLRISSGNKSSSVKLIKK